MPILKVKGIVARFATGIIGLSEEQAADRIQNLALLEDGRYEILRPIEFRAGETVDYDGEVSPLLLESVDLAEIPLESLTSKEIATLAKGEGLNLDARKKKEDLIQALLDFRAKKAGDALLEAKAAEEQAAKDARITELTAKGESMTAEEAAELLALKG
ncbi:hypothetical protein [Geothrix sp. 21YS21S-2]|uniref:hypothetical protein n=1 Tax=Geothrix sp. 21YS21S-2 TaxID=3068893 RepID=UPI0027BAA0C1|nr:hypothetical protein [Geothrix sp. 21YS21S-2]